MRIEEAHALLDLNTHRAIALDGPNFSGRSELLRAASGLAVSDESFDYQPAHSSPMAYIGPDIASAISGLASTVRAELRLHAASSVEQSPVAAFTKKLGLDRFYDRNPFTLSGGEQACLAIASALALTPEIVALDCPLEQLDNRMKPLVVEMLSVDVLELGAKVLLADNRLSECAVPFSTLPVSSLALPRESRSPAFGPIEPSVGIPPASTENGAIEISGLTFGYSKGSQVFTDLSVTLQAGKLYYLLGHNGAGKSTLAKILAGVIKPSTGELRFAGNWFEPYQRPGRVVTYHFQNPDLQLFSTTVEEEVLGRREGSRRERARAVMAAFGLDSVCHEHPLDLPFAMRKRVALAATIAAGSQWVILDEPTLGQDEASSRAIAGIIRSLLEAGMGVIVITHSSAFRGILPGEPYILDAGSLRAA